MCNKCKKIKEMNHKYYCKECIKIIARNSYKKRNGIKGPKYTLKFNNQIYQLKNKNEISEITGISVYAVYRIISGKVKYKSPAGKKLIGIDIKKNY